MVTIRLTDDEADLVWRSADGWLDAGACADGLTKAESNALNKLCTQILKQIVPAKVRAGRAP